MFAIIGWFFIVGFSIVGLVGMFTLSNLNSAFTGQLEWKVTIPMVFFAIVLCVAFTNAPFTITVN